MTTLEKSLDNALRHLQARATQELRAGAITGGWHPDVANSLSVSLSSDEAKVSVDDQFAARAFDYEYGSENQAPKATITKLNNSGYIEKELMRLFDAYIGGSK